MGSKPDARKFFGQAKRGYFPLKEENGNCGLATQLEFQVIYQKETEKEKVCLHHLVRFVIAVSTVDRSNDGELVEHRGLFRQVLADDRSRLGR